MSVRIYRCETFYPFPDLYDTLELKSTFLKIAATSRLLAIQGRQMVMIRGRNAGNIFDVIQLAYEASCFPGRFAASKELWENIVVQQGSRCLACNMLLLLPSFTLITHVSNIQLKTLFITCSDLSSHFSFHFTR